MLENNIYNIDRGFDYCTVKAIVSKTLEKIAKEEEALKKRATMTDDDVIFDYCSIDNNPNYVKLSAPPTPLLKLKIRNITKYLNWRLSILKRDNFTCKMCHTSVKQNTKTYLVPVLFWQVFCDIFPNFFFSLISQLCNVRACTFHTDS
jgi:hypothetical protein